MMTARPGGLSNNDIEAVRAEPSMHGKDLYDHSHTIDRSIFSRRRDTGRMTSGPVPGGNFCSQRSRDRLIRRQAGLKPD